MWSQNQLINSWLQQLFRSREMFYLLLTVFFTRKFSNKTCYNSINERKWQLRNLKFCLSARSNSFYAIITSILDINFMKFVSSNISQWPMSNQHKSVQAKSPPRNISGWRYGVKWPSRCWLLMSPLCSFWHDFIEASAIHQGYVVDTIMSISSWILAINNNFLSFTTSGWGNCAIHQPKLHLHPTTRSVPSRLYCFGRLLQQNHKLPLHILCSLLIDFHKEMLRYKQSTTKYPELFFILKNISYLIANHKVIQGSHQKSEKVPWLTGYTLNFFPELTTSLSDHFQNFTRSFTWSMKW